MADAPQEGAGGLPEPEQGVMAMRRLILVPIFAALMVLGGAAQAQDICDDPFFELFPAEVGLCRAYCTHMECDLINDGDPLSAPQASANACGNVAVSFFALLDGVKRGDVDLGAAVTELDVSFCDPDSCPPNCGGGTGL